ncbi:hypothetical protein PLESTB_001452100 [Pleodorina starrii]|uniref:Uncharacterized protein n=1 Tax=Pleodorina starrii TaxID=330485 RepID=A0A9W6BWG8_9CHLO|nr:hypothetical protein PLESTM_000773300 [Pleodorina starrii]GLC59135.1 hypothetical protein PLESTB_001452100 [Pleodorina starrii]
MAGTPPLGAPACVRTLVLAAAVASLRIADGSPSYGLPAALLEHLSVTGWDPDRQRVGDVRRRSGLAYSRNEVSLWPMWALERFTIAAGPGGPISARVALELQA